MAIGEIILKITDYPIAYSIAFLLLKVKNIDPLTSDAFPYLLAAGIVATFFTILDPIGLIIKGYMSLILYVNFKKHEEEEKILKSWSEIKSSFNTSSIEVEKDKIVNIVYFLFILGILMIFISFDEFFKNYFSSVDVSKFNCDSNCLQSIIHQSLSLVFIISAIFGGLKAFRILGRSKIVAIYHKCVNSPYVSDNTKQSLGEYIRLADWETAKVWKSKIEEEYVSEIGLQKERREKRKEHIHAIIQQFTAFKEKCEQSNRQTMLHTFDQTSTHTEYFLIDDIFKKFSNFEQLIQHCYSTKSSELYNQFLELMEANERFSHELSRWAVTRNSGLEKMIDLLDLVVIDRNKFKVIGDGGQWINLQRLHEQFDDFVSYYELRKMTFAPKQKLNSELYKVRFFDSSNEIQPQHDVVAELGKKNAEKLSAELGHLAETLRNMNASAQKEHVSRIEKKLKKLTEKILDAHHIHSYPIQGYCEYCLHDQFWSKKEILENLLELKKIPTIVFNRLEYVFQGKKNERSSSII